MSSKNSHSDSEEEICNLSSDSSSSSDSESSSSSSSNTECITTKIKRGRRGKKGCTGPVGPIGLTGLSGEIGPVGPSFASSYADYYALMPGDNSATIAVGADVEFPSDGPFLGGDIARLGPSSFNLVSIGTYQILFQVSINEPGQLVVSLNNLQQTYTTVGRATGTSQITGICLIQTLTSNSTLTIRNPTGNSTALTITPNAGGAGSVSAHLLIMRIN